MVLGVYGKKPTQLDADELIRNLGYWTDDGGYYWYNTEVIINSFYFYLHFIDFIFG